MNKGTVKWFNNQKGYGFISDEAGNDILMVKNLTKEPYFRNLSFTLDHHDKVAFICDNSKVITTLFNILMGLEEADSGSVKWGITITNDYIPSDNSSFFSKKGLSLADWLRQYSADETETFMGSSVGHVPVPHCLRKGRQERESRETDGIYVCRRSRFR